MLCELSRGLAPGTGDDEVNSLFAVLWKDLVIEWRTRSRLVAMAVFGLLVVVIFHFGAPEGEAARTDEAAGWLWTATLFASILGLNRSFALELENDALSGLALAPADRGFLFLGKAIANALLMFLVALLISGCFALGFELSFAGVGLRYIGLCALGSVGIASLGTLFSGMAARTAYREVLLPLLLLPLLIPVLIGAVNATQGLLTEGTIPADALRLLLVSNGVYLVVSFLGFEFVLDE